MLRPIAPLACLVFLAACTGGSNAGQITPGSAVVAEGMTLPYQAGMYHAFDMGGAARRATLVRYVPPDSVRDRLPRIDLFVYPVDRSLADEKATLRADMTSAGRSTFIEGTMFRGERPFPIDATGDTAYRADYHLEIERSPHRTLIYLHQVGDRYLMARTTFVRVVGMNPERFFDDAVEAMFAGARATDPAP